MSITDLRGKRVAVIGTLALALAGISLVASVMIGPFGNRESGSTEAAAYAARGAVKLKAAYKEWVKQHDAEGGDRYVAISLGYWKALSASYTTANGMATLNLIEGSVSVTASGLPTGEWDVWLVDNRPGPGQSVRLEASDATIRVGRLVRVGDTAKLDAKLGAAAFKKFHVDLVVVGQAGSDPSASGLLFGSPSLFQRLYTSLRSRELLMASDFATQPGIRVDRPWASMLGAPVAEAETGIFVNEDVVTNALVRQGADLFLNETFNGNGRTCASCHRKEVNFTIDVNFIASLPSDDPLFVAEFTPALAFSPTGPKFEVPVLMRKLALITENVDGTSDLVNRFTMRGIPHTLGLSLSITPANDGTTQPPFQRTGWSGDGAPGNGTLRDFATGAVTQHFTKTLNRVAGVDFRLPTDAELNAVEAFQLTLGRQAELSLPLALKDARAFRGQELFMSAGARCNTCHRNAGANAGFGGGGNRNFNTGVENQPDRPAEVTLKALNIDLTPDITTNILPRDGGFGQTPGDPTTGFGNGTFNTASLVEVADSGGFFHDNSIDTVEGAVAFYNSDAFNNSPSGTPNINLAATQVEAIAAFLRVINALDNIREASEAAAAARVVSNSNPRASDQLLNQAIGDIQDAMTVLGGRGLHPAAVASLQRAVVAFGAASIVNGFFARVDRILIDRGISALAAARADIQN